MFSCIRLVQALIAHYEMRKLIFLTSATRTITEETTVLSYLLHSSNCFMSYSESLIYTSF